VTAFHGARAVFAALRSRAAALACVAFLAVVLPEPGHAGTLLQDGTPVPVRTKAISTFEIGRTADRFGTLTFLGGLEILSSDRSIGGLSAMMSLEGGSVLFALTDNGHWVAADLDQTPEGAPRGLSNVRYAEMKGRGGRGLRGDWHHDTEAMTLDDEGGLLVSAERANAIFRYPWPIASGHERMVEELVVPEGIRGLRQSKGLEAIAMAPPGTPLAGTLVAVAERGASEAHDLPAFLISASSTQTFTIARSGRFDATDAVFLPGGDLLLLERRFNLRDLIGMRLRRFPASEIVPGARVTGEVLLEADYGFQIDNMEAMALHENARGELILTLLSDNNRSLLQRTILLRFRLDIP